MAAMQRTSQGRSRTACRRCNIKRVRCDVQLDLENLSTVKVPCSTCTAAQVRCEARVPTPRGGGQRSPEQLQFNRSKTSGTKDPSANAYIGDTGFLDMLVGANPDTTERQESVSDAEISRAVEHSSDVSWNIPATSQQKSVKVYLEHFYLWCPVLDMSPPSFSSVHVDSELLDHALASLAGIVADDAVTEQNAHYQRARHLFFAPEGPTALKRIIASTLFRSNNSPLADLLGMDSGFWWTGIAIRLAQTIGLHRDISSLPEEAAGLWRRVWWTLYARERVTALCQGRPCIIDDDYCDVRLPSLSDFPLTQQHKGNIFIHWIKLSIILGNINKQLFVSRRKNIEFPTAKLVEDLNMWISALPPSLRLTIPIPQHTPFDYHIYLLHVPYLAALIVVHLKISGESFPGASAIATIAASCTARIFEELMAQGLLDVLWGEVAWFIAIAVLALSQAQHIPSLSPFITRDISILKNALRYLAQTRYYAKIMQSGLKKINTNCQSAGNETTQTLISTSPNKSNPRGHASDFRIVPWTELMPFAAAAAIAHPDHSIAVMGRELVPTYLPPQESRDITDNAHEFWRAIDLLLSDPSPPLMTSERLDDPQMAVDQDFFFGF